MAWLSVQKSFKRAHKGPKPFPKVFVTLKGSKRVFKGNIPASPLYCTPPLTLSVQRAWCIFSTLRRHKGGFELDNTAEQKSAKECRHNDASTSHKPLNNFITRYNVKTSWFSNWVRRNRNIIFKQRLKRMGVATYSSTRITNFIKISIKMPLR